MVDPEINETARRIAVALIEAGESDPEVYLADACGQAVTLHKILGENAPHVCGHPAETALAQLFDLMGDHPDKLAFKWVRANAKERGMKELCAYLGAERE